MTEFPNHSWVNPLFAFTLGVALSLPVQAAEVPLLVTKIDGTQVRGELTAWTTEKLSLQAEGKTITVTSPQILRAEWQHESPSRSSETNFLELIDGTRLPHKGFEVVQGQATIATPLVEQPFLLSTDRIAFVQLSADAPGRDGIAVDQEGDLLVIRKKKTGKFDTLTGILGDVSSKQVEFNWDGESIPVKRSKVAGIAYYHAQVHNVKEPICWLNLLEGGRLPVASLSLTDKKVKVNTVSGLEFSLSLNTLQDADYSQGKLAYLSDLRPIEERWTPRIGMPKSAELIRQHGLPRRDQSYSGSALSLRWPSAKRPSLGGELRTYGKGLAMRSRTECRYRLPKGMRRFVAIAGIDPETASQGNVTLEIFSDQRSVWQGEIDGSAAPAAIGVMLGDARELRIVVDYGENLDFGDRLHLVEARLSK